MGKRSNFVRVERDYYKTPIQAVIPLIPHLSIETKFIEPCAGDGTLVSHLNYHGITCVWASDIEPQAESVFKLNALELQPKEFANTIITNPPWERNTLHAIILHSIQLYPTWLLFDADWPHTKQSAHLIKYCTDIVAIGRIKWIEGSPFVGKDNCCWYRFDKTNNNKPMFHGRVLVESNSSLSFEDLNI